MEHFLFRVVIILFLSNHPEITKNNLSHVKTGFTFRRPNTRPLGVLAKTRTPLASEIEKSVAERIVCILATPS